jgi:ATP-dependent 26S proteasome regulatory subunit
MLADSKSKSVVEEIKKFSTMKERFNRYGLLHKRGILLWGPPGGGKTCTVQLILQLIIEQGDGLGVQIEHPNEAVTALRIIRNIEPKRQIVAVLEDIDALVDRYGEAEYLSLLDGETQTDNIVYVATTNYPERLDRRFVDRPSRFDTIVWVGMPSLAARREYLLSKDPSWDKKELEYILHGTEGYSIAHLREIFILIKCFEYPMKEAVEKVSKMKNAKPSSEDSPDKKKVGFA